MGGILVDKASKGSKGKKDDPFTRQQAAIEKYGEEPTFINEEQDALGLFAALMETVQTGAPPLPSLPPLPTVYREPEIDWEKRQDKLASKASADFNTSKRKKKGRTSTIATSPLIEDEKTSTTKSLVNGS